ncbi:alanine racemase [Rickettsiella massiliensis]|uniref:alanine racemase n=1 Tax=Rickettsiella massiliensis TaxID=676517 RepID=UPI00029A3A4B|nr:alanine racemase [Rickettsiella massiliensis]
MSRPLVIELDRHALRQNVQRLRSIAPHSKLLAMVKANAYGHGLILIAQALEPLVDGFGVSCTEEALLLRQAGIRQRIVLMEGLLAADERTFLAAYQLETVVHDCHQLKLLTAQRLVHPVKVWLKMNTGMNRLGFSLQEFPEVWRQCQACSWLEVAVLMTHFASSDERHVPTTAHQLALFERATQNLAVEKSIANSAAILEWPQTHQDWIRPGLALYGVSPFADRIGSDYGLKPVMQLNSQIISIHPLQRGEKVGYGGVWRNPRDTRVGVVAMGYGDGYPRCAPNGTPVYVNHQCAPLVGRVSMDMLTVDLSHQPQAQHGDPVCLWGHELPIETVARHAGAFSYELLCGINRGQLVRMHIEEKK